VQSYTLEQAQAKRLGAQHALLSYRADFTRPGESAPHSMYVSSIWERRGGGWINLFSQDTPCD